MAVWRLVMLTRMPTRRTCVFALACVLPIMVTSITAAHNVEAHHGTFNDVGQNQYNYNIQVAPLQSALSTATIITSIVQQAESSREQLLVLGASVNTLLSALHAEYCAGRLLESNTSVSLKNLNL
jgi:hypothetical protein